MIHEIINYYEITWSKWLVLKDFNQIMDPTKKRSMTGATVPPHVLFSGDQS